MSDEAAVASFSDATKELGDKIAEMTLKEAKELSDYLKDEHGIEPAAGGGAVVMQQGDGAGPAEEEQTEFDVVLTGFGENKVPVVKVVKGITGATLLEAKKMVDGVPSTLKEKAEKEEAEKIKADLEAAGASVELK